MSKNSIQDKKKSHLKQKVAWAEPRLMIKMANCCFGAAHPQNIWRSSSLHQKCKKRRSTCRRVFMLATIQRISSVFKSRRDGGHEVKLIRDRFKKTTGLSGGVGAGTRAMAPATRWSGARAAPSWGPPPRGARPARQKYRNIHDQSPNGPK